VSSSDRKITKDYGWKEAKLKWITSIIVLTTAVVSLVLIVPSHAFDGLFGPHPTAKITEPSGPSVPKEFRLTGRSNLHNGDILWVVSWRYDDRRYYPQDRACTIHNDGSFDCGGYYLGNQEGGDVGEDFDLIVMLADADTVNTFSAYQNQKMGNETGLSELPKSADILDREKVTRK
jgi:hypothetical protein